MTSYIRASCVVVVAAGSLLALGCSAGDSEQQAEDGASQSSAFRVRHRHRTSGTGSSTGGSATSGGAAPMGGSATMGGSVTTSAGSSSAGDGTIEAAIAAAQTPDGQAIPQDASPDGQCPEVLRLLGFWSCPQLERQCTFQANGVLHSCICLPMSGEGQYPSWSCDQP